MPKVLDRELGHDKRPRLHVRAFATAAKSERTSFRSRQTASPIAGNVRTSCMRARSHLLLSAVFFWMAMLLCLDLALYKHVAQVKPVRHHVVKRAVARAADPMPGLRFYPLSVVATSYCPDAYSGPYTATGAHPRRGVAAVDPRVIPLGSVILWNHNVYLAQDTGSVVLGRVVDFWNDRCDDSINWGRKPITILVGRA